MNIPENTCVRLCVKTKSLQLKSSAVAHQVILHLSIGCQSMMPSGGWKKQYCPLRTPVVYNPVSNPIRL